MRQKLLFYTLLAAIVGDVFWACQRDRLGYDGPNTVKPTLTVVEARVFFESQMEQVVFASTKLPDDKPTALMPGDFTPLWDRATGAVADRWTEGIDLPIDPHFIFTAEFRKIEGKGDTVFKTVDIVQKLVVNRWHDHPLWNGMYVYIASVIPTPEYYAQHKDFGRRFVNLGKKEGFSGLVIYHTLDGYFVNADKYRNGQRVGQVYDPAGVPSLEQVLTLLEPEVTVYGGTPAMYSLNVETPEVQVQACRRCKMQDCHCQDSGGGCYCQTIGHEWDDHVDPTPPVTPPGGGTGGGGGSTGGNTDNNSGNELMDESKFVGYSTSGDCMQGCIQILANYGIYSPTTSVFILATEGLKGSLDIHAERYMDGVNIINRHINQGRPIIVGISRGWGMGVGNSNAATDHFVVVTGRGYDIDANLYYFTYMETGVSDPSRGCNVDTNRLYIDSSIPDIVDHSPLIGTTDYHVTEVRVNDGN